MEMSLEYRIVTGIAGEARWNLSGGPEDHSNEIPMKLQANVQWMPSENLVKFQEKSSEITAEFVGRLDGRASTEVRGLAAVGFS